MGSSGGGSSGAVSHSVYLEWAHADWLNDGQLDSIEKSVTSAMNDALGGSPWAGLSAYNPAVPIAAYEAELTAFKAILTGIVDTTNWAALFTQAAASIGATPATIVVADKTVADVAVVDMADSTDITEITDVEIVADVTALSDQLDDEITTKVLPRFRRGMQDINAVVSSAFPIGEAIIEGFRNREVAKHNSSLRIAAASKNADIRMSNEQLHVEVGKANLSKDVEISRANVYKDTELAKVNMVKDTTISDANVKNLMEYKRMHLDGTAQMLNLLLHRVAWNEGVVKASIEANRIKIVALKEQIEGDASIDEADARWDLEVFQYGSNVMAAVAGGTSSAGAKSIPKAVSAIGGAMSGAAAGGMIASAVYGTEAGSSAGPYGAAIGAVLGAAVGLLSSN